MRSMQFLAVVGLAAAGISPPSLASDGVKQQSVAIAREPLPPEATQLVDPLELQGYSILGRLATLQKRKGVAISLDEAGLEDVCKKKLRDINVHQAEFSLPLAAAVEYLAIQVHGTVRIRGKSFHIVAGTGDLMRFLSPPVKNDSFDIKTQLTIEKRSNRCRPATSLVLSASNSKCRLW